MLKYDISILCDFYYFCTVLIDSILNKRMTFLTL